MERILRSPNNDFEQRYKDDIEKIRCFLQDKRNSVGKHWRVRGPYDSGKTPIIEKAINSTNCLNSGCELIFHEPVTSKKEFLRRIKTYCDHKTNMQPPSISVDQLLTWYRYKEAVNNLLGTYLDKNVEDEKIFFDCLLEIQSENKLVWWIGACTDAELRELNKIYDQLMQHMRGRAVERDFLPTILIEQWTSELTEWDDCDIRQVPRNLETPNISETEKTNRLTQTPIFPSKKEKITQNITELAISSEHDTLLTDTVIQEVFGVDNDLTDDLKSSLRTTVNEYAGRHFGANTMIFEALAYAKTRSAANGYIEDLLGSLKDNDASGALENIESLLVFYETERQLDLFKWSEDLGKSIATHIRSRPYLYGLGVCIKKGNSYPIIRWLRNPHVKQGEERMDPFISYIAAVAPVLTPLIVQASEPVAEYFGKQTVELLKRLFGDDEDPVKVAGAHQQTLNSFIESKVDWTQPQCKTAYDESMKAMQDFVQRPDVFPAEPLLRQFYSALNIAVPFGPYEPYEDERRGKTMRETAAHFVYLAWSEKKLHIAAEWLQKNRAASFEAIRPN